jgi:hypothetical protein
MAEKKKTVKKTAPTKKVKEAPKEKETEVQVETEVVKPQRKKKVEIDRNELVLCRNVTDGQLIYKSRKTGLTTLWMNYGDTEYLDVAELLTMKSSQPKFLNDVWLVVDDDVVVEFLGLKHIYKDLVDVDDIDSFFDKTPAEIEKALVKLPKGLKDTVGTRARKLVESGDLYDNRKISVIEDNLKIGLKIFVD